MSNNGCGERCWRYPQGIELNEHEWRFGVEQPGRMEAYGGRLRRYAVLVGSVGTRKGRPANEGGGGASEDIPKRFLAMCSVAAEGPLHMALPGDHRQPRQRDQIARGRSSRAGGRSTKSAAQNIRVSRVHAGKRVSRARAGKKHMGQGQDGTRATHRLAM